eukprot:CAMPEP_0194387260 /NCGR_PEP_ID=MMETSP0174-20130528/91242_1 /TAXON_ID=216777 /ORGANISM="Proboscia alata, Strain PI-D3" /LENGTH=39 /DNA_ID= /DNA_START= /DNA_END= /DNA_ORIENTATION=
MAEFRSCLNQTVSTETYSNDTEAVTYTHEFERVRRNLTS